MLDVGCGTGEWLRAWIELGVEDVVGIDGDYVDRGSIAIPPDRFLARDLSSGRVSAGRRFDLVMAVEVAEHLPPSAADDLVASLTAHAPVVLFSAAVPGQGGPGHVNEQWPEYWVRRFSDRGCVLFDVLRPRIWTDESIDYWYRQNALLFVSGEEIERYGALAAGWPSFAGHAVVHPVRRRSTSGS